MQYQEIIIIIRKKFILSKSSLTYSSIKIKFIIKTLYQVILTFNYKKKQWSLYTDPLEKTARLPKLATTQFIAASNRRLFHP